MVEGLSVFTPFCEYRIKKETLCARFALAPPRCLLYNRGTLNTEYNAIYWPSGMCLMKALRLLVTLLIAGSLSGCYSLSRSIVNDLHISRLRIEMEPSSSKYDADLKVILFDADTQDVFAIVARLLQEKGYIVCSKTDIDNSVISHQAANAQAIVIVSATFGQVNASVYTPPNGFREKIRREVYGV